MLTLLDADAPGDPVRVARLRARTWSKLGSGQVILVGSTRQLEHAVTDLPTRLGRRPNGPRQVESLDIRAEPGRLTATDAAVVYTPHLGYLAGRVPDCGLLHFDWRRTYVRESTSGIYVTVLRGHGPVFLDVYLPGPGIGVCTRHHGWVLTPTATHR